MKMTDRISKCIPWVYLIYIPLSVYLFIFGSVTGAGHVFFGYLMDVVKIAVIVLFAHYVVVNSKGDDPGVNPARFFSIFAGICFLEFVFTFSMHGRYIHEKNTFAIVYMIFMAAEYLAEGYALYKLDISESMEFKGGIMWSNLITVGAVLWTVFGQSEIGLPLACMSVFFRELIRVLFLVRYISGWGSIFEDDTE